MQRPRYQRKGKNGPFDSPFISRAPPSVLHPPSVVPYSTSSKGPIFDSRSQTVSIALGGDSPPSGVARFVWPPGGWVHGDTPLAADWHTGRDAPLCIDLLASKGPIIEVFSASNNCGPS